MPCGVKKIQSAYVSRPALKYANSFPVQHTLSRSEGPKGSEPPQFQFPHFDAP